MCRSPASICFSGANEAFVPALKVCVSSAFCLAAGCASADMLRANRVPARVIAALVTKRRRLWLIFSGICSPAGSRAPCSLNRLSFERPLIAAWCLPSGLAEHSQERARLTKTDTQADLGHGLLSLSQH